MKTKMNLSLQLPIKRGYPHFYVLEHDGTFLHSQGTGELGQRTGYNEQVFADFLDHWKPHEHNGRRRRPCHARAPRPLPRNRLSGSLLIE